MGKCPKCGKEIDHLVFEERSIWSVGAEYRGNGEYGDEEREHEYNTEGYYCPSCHKLIADTESEADEILSGVVVDADGN